MNDLNLQWEFLEPVAERLGTKTAVNNQNSTLYIDRVHLFYIVILITSIFSCICSSFKGTEFNRTET